MWLFLSWLENQRRSQLQWYYDKHNKLQWYYDKHNKLQWYDKYNKDVLGRGYLYTPCHVIIVTFFVCCGSCMTGLSSLGSWQKMKAFIEVIMCCKKGLQNWTIIGHHCQGGSLSVADVVRPRTAPRRPADRWPTSGKLPLAMAMAMAMQVTNQWQLMDIWCRKARGLFVILSNSSNPMKR